MRQIVAPCGLICTECAAYKATRAEDANAIAAVAAEWSRKYGIPFEPENIWCDGCTTVSERTAHHTRECPIRPCALGRGVTTCAKCADYCCGQLSRVHRLAPEARRTLDGIRARAFRPQP